MAPKSPAPRTTPAKTKQAGAPKGLQLSAAQWKAYNLAYNASASAQFRQLAIQSAAATLRQSRLTAAYKTGKAAAAAHAVARTAAIAAFAAKMSYQQSKLAHQNIALAQRVAADYQHHVRTAARLQYIYKGEKAYAHQAVLNTVTSAQALTFEQARFAQAAKAAKSALRSTLPAQPNPARTAAVAKIQANAKAAALRAARATPAGRTAPRPDRLRTPAAVHSFGNPEGRDCVAAAIANHLLFQRRYRLTRQRYADLAATLGDAPTLTDALTTLMRRPPWAVGPRLVSVRPAGRSTGRVLVLGFAAELGPHAACDTGHGIASWGDVLPLADVMAPGAQVEETWDLLWVLPRPGL